MLGSHLGQSGPLPGASLTTCVATTALLMSVHPPLMTINENDDDDTKEKVKEKKVKENDEKGATVHKVDSSQPPYVGESAGTSRMDPDTLIFRDPVTNLNLRRAACRLREKMKKGQNRL